MSKRNIGCNTVEDIVRIHKEFYAKNGKYPIRNDFNCNDTLPTVMTIEKIIHSNNITYNQFIYNNFYFLDIENLKYQKVINEYGFLVSILKEYCIKLGHVPTYLNISQKYGLPNARWYIKYSKNDKVIDYNTFIEYELDLLPRYEMSKEMATKVVFEMQSKLNRPLMKKDLSRISDGGICESIIKKYWGTLNKMKLELGLEVVQESMQSRMKPIESIKQDVQIVCEYIKDTENRLTVMQSDWKKVRDAGFDIYAYSSTRKSLEQSGITLREYVNELGYDMVEAGIGLHYQYSSGETISSQYEKLFTDFLRDDLNLQYNKDYFRSVRYKTFINSYKGLMDCDYVVNYKDRKIYIEIAGMFRDNYDNWKTYNFTSNRKITYVKKLKLKEQMFKDNGLDYYIVLPRDCNEEFFMSIFDDKNIK